MKMKLDNGTLIIADCDGMQLNIIKSWNKMKWNSHNVKGSSLLFYFVLSPDGLY